jgi:hypothetical protein
MLARKKGNHLQEGILPKLNLGNTTRGKSAGGAGR